MSLENAVLKLAQAINKHDVSTFTAMWDEEAVVHDPSLPQPLKGKGAVRQNLEAWLTAFPDVHYKPSNIFTKDDVVTFEVEVSGTHKGPFTIPGGSIEPTNQRMALRGMGSWRVTRSGLIAEERRYYDSASLLHQLGATMQHLATASIEAGDKALVRRFLVEMDQRRSVPEEMCSAEFIAGINDGSPIGIAGFKQFMGSLYAAFPDFVVSIDETVAEGGRIAARLTGRGTHKGQYQGIAATGRAVKVVEFAVFRLNNGKLTDMRCLYNEAGLMRDLGGAPVSRRAA